VSARYIPAAGGVDVDYRLGRARAYPARVTARRLSRPAELQDQQRRGMASDGRNEFDSDGRECTIPEGTTLGPRSDSSTSRCSVSSRTLFIRHFRAITGETLAPCRGIAGTRCPKEDPKWTKHAASLPAVSGDPGSEPRIIGHRQTQASSAANAVRLAGMIFSPRAAIQPSIDVPKRSCKSRLLQT
jgi:hypothetical protein